MPEAVAELHQRQALAAVVDWVVPVVVVQALVTV